MSSTTQSSISPSIRAKLDEMLNLACTLQRLYQKQTLQAAQLLTQSRQAFDFISGVKVLHSLMLATAQADVVNATAWLKETREFVRIVQLWHRCITNTAEVMAELVCWNPLSQSGPITVWQNAQYVSHRHVFERVIVENIAAVIALQHDLLQINKNVMAWRDDAVHRWGETERSYLSLQTTHPTFHHRQTHFKNLAVYSESAMQFAQIRARHRHNLDNVNRDCLIQYLTLFQLCGGRIRNAIVQIHHHLSPHLVHDATLHDIEPDEIGYIK